MGAINLIALMLDFVYYPIPILAAIWILTRLWQLYDELEYLKERPLAERYGEGSWAVVTGATGGIGLGFVEAFSTRGFHVVLIGRSQAKLDKTIRVLKKKFNKTKYRTILADTTETPTKEFYDGIISKMSDLDVSVLVNNVGSLEFQKFTEQDPKVQLDISILNTGLMAMLSYHFAARIAQRKKDKELPRKGGAIINMSSMACTDPTSFVEPYCASKRFGQIFSTELSAIFGMDVDIICSKPGFVDTELEKRIPGNHTGVVSVGECVNGTLRAQGLRDETYGANLHVKKGALIDIFGQWILNHVNMEKWRGKGGPGEVEIVGALKEKTL